MCKCTSLIQRDVVDIPGVYARPPFYMLTFFRTVTLHIQWVPGALSPGIKRREREANHSRPTSAEVKKTWIYTSTLLYAFTASCLIS
jgi:hypothetical protein